MQGTHPELERRPCAAPRAATSSRHALVVAELVVDVCSSCHPAYTGIEREIARGSRVERFERRRARAATA